MTVIWKQKLDLPHNTCHMPRGAVVLCAQAQNDIPTIWFICDPSQPVVERRFAVICTGDDSPTDFKHYIGTCQLVNDVFIVHVFEVQ